MKDLMTKINYLRRWQVKSQSGSKTRAPPSSVSAPKHKRLGEEWKTKNLGVSVSVFSAILQTNEYGKRVRVNATEL